MTVDLIKCGVLALMLNGGTGVDAIEYDGTYESLRNYECPEWFRDAKFGIWSHWGPQSVPAFGDWYARFMYLPGVDGFTGSPAYDYHLDHYGHPSEFGYKDLIPLFTAEKWEPEKLMKLYKRAGARYFVSMGQHHDNFDMWDSKYQPWNAVNMGPKKDIVRIWQDAAQKEGLMFGVSFHGLASWQWFESARLADLEGPKKGVRYDGWLTEKDGKGKWWDGYNPQDLYGKPHEPTTPTHVRWPKQVEEKGDPASPEYLQRFENRIRDIVDHYQPELIYFDSGVITYDQDDARQIMADYYNASTEWNNGTNQAVMTAKHLSAQDQEMFVLDYENTHSGELRALPWQTDIGYDGWFLYERPEMKGMATEVVVHTLVDIVSKNGNMLMNICQTADGSIQPYAYTFLEEMGDWMAINSEAIHGTRPWVKFGEGPHQVGKAKDKQHQYVTYSSADFRFTTKGHTLYAILMDWPDDKNKVVIQSLATNEYMDVSKIEQVSLLGADNRLTWTKTDAGLEVELPTHAPCDYAYVIKIQSRE